MKFDRASRWQRVISAKYNVKVSICCSIFKSMLTAKYNLRIYLGYSMLSHIWKMNGEGLRYLCLCIDWIIKASLIGGVIGLELDRERG